MGGDGATTGNYALVYQDAGGAIFDYGLVHFSDTGTQMTFHGRRVHDADVLGRRRLVRHRALAARD